MVPVVRLDPALIRPCFERADDFPIDWSKVKMVSSVFSGSFGEAVDPFAGFGEGDGHFGNLRGGEYAAHGSAVDLQGEHAGLHARNIARLESDSLDIVGEQGVSGALGEIVNSAEEFGGNFDGGCSGEKKAEVCSLVVSDNADLAIVAHDARALPIGILADHSHSFRVESQACTITEAGGGATAPGGGDA